MTRGRVSELLLIGGTACAVLLWSIYAYMISTTGVLDRAGSVKGWDFPQFYAIGRLGLTHHRSDLSSGEAIKSAALEAVSPTMRTNVFVPYGPQVALLFSPFAVLPHSRPLPAGSVSRWSSTRRPACRCGDGANRFGARRQRSCCWPRSPVLFFVMCYGQLSAVALGLFTVAFFALESGPSAPSRLGTRFALCTQLGLAPGLILLAAGEWRIVAAAVASAAAQIAIALSYAGSAVLRGYLPHADAPQ